MATGKILLMLTGLAAVASAFAAAPEGFDANTKAIDDVPLSFVRAGMVTTVAVKEGQTVQAGQVLAEQDDSAERIQLAQLQAQAESTVRIRAAKAALDLKDLAFKRTEKAFQHGGATELEVETARLESVQAELSMEMVKLEHEQDARKCEELKAQLEKMKIRSPIAGKVVLVKVSEGETVEAMKMAIRVVNTARLVIDVYVPVAQAAQIAQGAAARIVFTTDSVGTAEGEVKSVDAVADPASGTRKIRVEFENKTGRPAGERVKVSFQPASQPSNQK